ncbi:inactive LRR receptor-like serine/threonine-protein kinase BIR2 [Triticum aestivum]|uniref:inactive LRR receptor-like serine/threonine-protein kinase BIR2 n=1 Tax=Triticum aestivum TaxID=4565 RepID=UPI001D02EC72|nr:inactive LRR receptor-like serine/threonine-protein kinase BIR2 [Triticum aestivum]
MERNELLTWHFFCRNPPHLLLLALALALTLPPAAPQPAPGSAAEPQEDDARCLKGVKAGLRDPEGRLTSWTSNTSAGAVCDFSGISCLNPQESRILAVSLSGFGLQGKIPPALQYCRSANTLDLSSNALEGQIPPALCDWIPFVVNLDLSGNRLTGPLPSELANCRFLNSLKLSDNAFSGQIPASLARLDRLKALDLSGNRLEGQIPSQLGSAFSKDSFSGNSGLCGHPVSSRCGSGLGGTGLGIVIAAGVFGAAASLLLAFFFWRCTGKGKAGRRRQGRGGSESEVTATYPDRAPPRVRTKEVRGVSAKKMPRQQLTGGPCRSDTPSIRDLDLFVTSSPRLGSAQSMLRPRTSHDQRCRFIHRAARHAGHAHGPPFVPILVGWFRR